MYISSENGFRKKLTPFEGFFNPRSGQ